MLDELEDISQSIRKHKKKIKEIYLEQRRKMPKSDAQLKLPVPEAGAMEELFQYDVSSTSYLFVEDLMMTKPQKSVLVQDLETTLTNHERAPQWIANLQTACIADVMPNIRKIKTNDIQTFGNFCEQFLEYISAIGQGPDRLDVVFDSYVEGSIKDSEKNSPSRQSPN